MRHTREQDNASGETLFNGIYSTNVDGIFRFCYIRVSDREQAMDITQEVFTRLWQSILDGKNIEYPKAFLFTVARNCIIDWYRKKKAVSLESLEDPDVEEPYEQFTDSTLAESLLEGEGRFLVESIGKISDGNRDAVYLRYVEGLSPLEIGRVLKISANAASVRINRGLQELRAITGYDTEIGIDAK